MTQTGPHPTGPQATRPQPTRLGRRAILEVVTAVLLGLVSVATAAGAYQASVWNREATELSGISQQLRDRNLSTYISGSLGFADDSRKLGEALAIEGQILFYPEREAELRELQRQALELASPGLVTAWDEWVAAGFSEDTVPMTTGTYTADLYLAPASMNRVSATVHDIALDYRERGVQITIASVVFAIALLLLGVSGVGRSYRRAVLLAGGGATAFLVGVVVTAIAFV